MVRRIESEFVGVFRVSTKNSNLPKFKGKAYGEKSVYRPDIIFRAKSSGEITHMIEVARLRRW